MSYSAPTVAFVTLGCAKNEVDTDRMRALVHASAFEVLADEPNGVEVERADIVVVNTCSFLTAATEEAIEVIFEVLGQDTFVDGDAQLVVTGCMPSRYGDELEGALSEVSAFLPTTEEDSIVEVLERITGFSATSSCAKTAERSSYLRTVTQPSAYVKIADGCDRFCSFCTIPFIRGRYRSNSAATIVAEVAGLVDAGVREIVLIGQDTGIWGSDLSPAGHGDPASRSSHVVEDLDFPHNLPGLLDVLARRFPTTWFRIMYLQPEGVSDALLDTMRTHGNICDYLDIPLQHASKRVLEQMNREGSAEEYLALLRHIRSVLPLVTLRTTLIAGFPGETREDAKLLEDFLFEASFDYVGVFVYSREEGTKAAERSDQVPMRTRKARAQRLRDCADRSGFARNTEKVGDVLDVLVCGHEYDEESGEGKLVGRTQGQAPEVDGVVHLDTGTIGEIIPVRIVDAYCYELEGEPV